jgi:hypothetical protein
VSPVVHQSSLHESILLGHFESVSGDGGVLHLVLSHVVLPGAAGSRIDGILKCIFEFAARATKLGLLLTKVPMAMLGSTHLHDHLVLFHPHG